MKRSLLLAVAFIAFIPHSNLYGMGIDYEKRKDPIYYEKWHSHGHDDPDASCIYVLRDDIALPNSADAAEAGFYHNLYFTLPLTYILGTFPWPKMKQLEWKDVHESKLEIIKTCSKQSILAMLAYASKEVANVYGCSIWHFLFVRLINHDPFFRPSYRFGVIIGANIVHVASLALLMHSYWTMAQDILKKRRQKYEQEQQMKGVLLDKALESTVSTAYGAA